MALTRANIVDFANVIAGGAGSTVTMNRAYAEVTQNLAQRFEPPLVETTTFTVSSGTASYSLPSTGVKLVGLFNENTQLTQVNSIELESYNREWRASSTDAPKVYYVDEDTLRSVRLFPSPSTGSTGTWLVSVAPIADIPDYMGLYIAFAVLEREFSHPSDHQDKTFSKLCGDIAQIFGMLVGLV